MVRLKITRFIKSLIHSHYWETTHTNGFNCDIQQFCRGCGEYRHIVLSAEHVGRDLDWQKGKHPKSKEA